MLRAACCVTVSMLLAAYGSRAVATAGVVIEGSPRSRYDSPPICITLDGVRTCLPHESGAIGSVDAVHPSASAVLLTGDLVGKNGNVVIVLGRDPVGIVSLQLCHGPTVAPDGKAVVFETFVPRLTPRDEVQQTVEVLLVEPVARATVYPARIPGDVVPRWYSRSPFAWSGDSRSVSFLAEREERDGGAVFEFVTATRGPGERDVSTSVETVDVKAFLAPGFELAKARIGFETLDVGAAGTTARLIPMPGVIVTQVALTDEGWVAADAANEGP